MNALVVAAHPDDMELGCGGTIARLADEGYNVHVLILAQGLAARGSQDEGAFESLREQSIEAMSRLGVAGSEFCNFPDNQMDIVPLLHVVKKIEDVVDSLQPTMVFTHHAGDLNVDHRVVHQATLTATRPMKGMSVDALYAFEVPSSTEWAFGNFQPNFFVDIEDYLSQKVLALKCYEGEMRTFPHPRSEKALCAIAERWGSVIGVPAAEAFELIRERY